MKTNKLMDNFVVEEQYNYNSFLDVGAWFSRVYFITSILFLINVILFIINRKSILMKNQHKIVITVSIINLLIIILTHNSRTFTAYLAGETFGTAMGIYNCFICIINFIILPIIQIAMLIYNIKNLKEF